MLDALFVREILICQKCNIESCHWKNHKDKLTSLSTDSGIATFFHVPKIKKVSQEHPVHQNQLTQSNLHKV